MTDMTGDPGQQIKEFQTFAATASESQSPDGIYKAADTLAQNIIGHRLFTVMQFDPTQMEVARIYSSDPDSYPIGGRKKKRDTPWGRHVLEEGRTYIGHNQDDIRWAFDDSTLILNLGLISVLNIPIKRHGTVIGTMNLLDSTDHYDDDSAKVGTAITLGLAHAFLHPKTS